MLERHEIESARRQGWVLADVFDPAKQRVTCEILPVTFKPPFTTARAAILWVVARARQNDDLAIKALRLVMQGHKR